MQFPPQQPQVAFGLPYLFVELFYIDMSVVRTDERMVTWLPKFLGWVDYHIFLGWGSSAIIKGFFFFSDFNTDAKLIRTLLLFPGIVPQWLRSDRIGFYSFHFRISKSREFPSVFFAKRTGLRVRTLSISQDWLARPVILKKRKRYYSFFLPPITAVHTI